MASCSLAQNPDKGFDEEYSDSWDIVSPSVESSQQEKEIPSSTLQKTFQISGTDQGYQCTMTCTKPE